MVLCNHRGPYKQKREAGGGGGQSERWRCSDGSRSQVM